VDLSSLLVAPVLFFALGVFMQVVGSDFKFPGEASKALSIYLLAGIGLHGGAELGQASLAAASQAVLAAALLGLGLPLLGYALLRSACRLDRYNAAAIAAHYGSVSAGTFLAAVAWLQARELPYEGTTVVMLAVMESPAILVALLLAQHARRSDPQRRAGGAGQGARSLLADAFTHGSVLLLLGSMAIGALISDRSYASVKPFFEGVFMGALCLFLLEMGLEAARRLAEFRAVGLRLAAFGIGMPLVGGAIGLAIGHAWLGYGPGGTLLVAVLGASASYIAVPPAVRLAIPEANPSFYLTLSLGITFPFNVVIGIPLYYALALRLAA
jgi:hypothetical protein